MRIATVDGWFNRIRHVAAMCPPTRTHWRYLANTIEHVHFSAHWSPQPKRHLDRFSCFWQLKSDRGMLFPSKLPSHGASVHPCNTWFLRSIRFSVPNGISIGSAVFARLTTVTDRPTDRYSTLLGRYITIVLRCGLIID